MKIILYIAQTDDRKRDEKPRLSAENRALVDMAVEIKKQASGHLAVMTCGFENQKPLLREALARGCDEAYFLERSESSETNYEPVFPLAGSWMREIGFDLILTGYRTLDGYSSYIGAQIAEYLRIPQISFVDEVTEWSERIRVRRSVQDMVQVMESPFPCLLTLTNSRPDAAPMSVTNIIRAFEKEIFVCTREQQAKYSEPYQAHSPYRSIEVCPAAFSEKQCELYYTIENEDGEGGMIKNVMSAEAAVDAVLEQMRNRGLIS